MKTGKYGFQDVDLKLFWYWIDERESIRQAKDTGKPWPWTKDKILQEYKFTNVFRRQDRTTRDMVERVREYRDEPVRLYNHINTFRLFNWTETYDEIAKAINEGDWDWIEARLRKRKERGGLQLWTGAYMIHASPGAKADKLADYIVTLKLMWEESEHYVASIRSVNSLEETVKFLQKYNHVGPFIAYELACDYAYFKSLLSKAPDKMTWANTGPGAARGIHRLMTGSHEKPFNGINYVAQMRRLLLLSGAALSKHVPPLEMRDIEHSLCEYDKYCRVYHDEGRAPKQKYGRPT